MAQTIPLARLFWIFLKIGSTAWGGFLPFIAVVQNYLVRRSLLDEAEIADAIFVATILPGPVAMNFTAGVGYRMRGLAGAAVCWFAALLPTFIFVVVLSALYFRYGSIPVVGRVFAGIVPAVVAIVIGAALTMGQKNVKNVVQGAIAAIAFALLLVSNAVWTTVGIVVAAGIAGYLLFRGRTAGEAPKAAAPTVRMRAISPLPFLGAFIVKPALTAKLFLTFAVMSVTLFGGGYVFIPVIQSLVVDAQHWVTRREFVDGIAISQITPGPILIATAFVGYKVAGLLGAVASTLGMFLPPAIIMLIAIHYLTIWKRWHWVNAALSGIRPAVVGMLLAAAVYVARTTDWSIVTVVILAAALIAIIRYKVEVAIVIPLAGATGLLFTH